MSQDGSSADVIAQDQAALVSNYALYATTALVAYEYFLTLENERTIAWKRKKSGPTWLFLANRYLMVASTIATVAPTTPKFCTFDFYLGSIFNILPFVVTAVFSALRVYALAKPNLLTTSLVFLLSIVPVVTNSFELSRAIPQSLGAGPDYFCYGATSLSASTLFQLGLATRISVILADIIVIIVTWKKTFWVRGAASIVGQKSLTRTLLSYGSLYFVALVLLNTAQLVADNVPLLANFNFIAEINAVMQPILIGRFIINLHDANDSLRNNEASSPSKMESDVYFRIPSVVDTVVGNMGQTLRVGGEPHGALDVEDEIEKFDDLQIATRSEDAVDALTVLDWDDGGLHEIPRSSVV